MKTEELFSKDLQRSSTYGIDIELGIKALEQEAGRKLSSAEIAQVPLEKIARLGKEAAIKMRGDQKNVVENFYSDLLEIVDKVWGSRGHGGGAFKVRTGKPGTKENPNQLYYIYTDGGTYFTTREVDKILRTPSGRIYMTDKKPDYSIESESWDCNISREAPVISNLFTDEYIKEVWDAKKGRQDRSKLEVIYDSSKGLKTEIQEHLSKDQASKVMEQLWAGKTIEAKKDAATEKFGEQKKENGMSEAMELGNIKAENLRPTNKDKNNNKGNGRDF